MSRMNILALASIGIRKDNHVGPEQNRKNIETNFYLSFMSFKNKSKPNESN